MVLNNKKENVSWKTIKIKIKIIKILELFETSQPMQSNNTVIKIKSDLIQHFI